MIHRRFAMLGLSLAAGTALPLACSPQVVDAVDTRPGTGGSTASGGKGGSSASGGSAGSAAGSGGSMCPGGSTADRDGDSTPDCLDGCPDDSEKTSFGLCGCGFSDGDDGMPSCLDLRGLLAHRYTFNTVGSVAVDSIGDASGTVMGTELDGTGSLTLDGVMTEQYVELPNRLFAELESVTFEAWLQWSGGTNWQRIFDFGQNNGAGAGEQGPNGTSFLFLTCRTPNDPVLTVDSEVAPQSGKLRLAYLRPGAREHEVTLDAEIAMPSGVQTPTQVVAVIDGVAQRMSLYIDGELQPAVAHFKVAGAGARLTATTFEGSGVPFTRMEGTYDWSADVTAVDGGAITPPAVDLSLIDDANNWIGRSQFVGDDELGAVYHEFRVYSGALTPELVHISFEAGPDPTFFDD